MSVVPAVAYGASITADQFLELGLNIDYKSNPIWKNDSTSRKLQKFWSSYRAHPKAIERIWFYLNHNPCIEQRVKTNTKAADLLIVYRWWSLYETELELHKHFMVSEKHVRFVCKDFPPKIAALKTIFVS